MLIFVVILFFICWGPRLVMEVLQKYHLVPFNNSMYRMRMTFNILTFIHACVNPFIYCFMSKNFRVRFLRIAELCGLKKKQYARASDALLVPAPSQKSENSLNNCFKERYVDIKVVKKHSMFGSETKQTDTESVVCNCGSVPPVP